MFDTERDPTAVELDLFVPQVPSTVWRALTEPSLIRRWLARSTGFVAEVGATFILEIPADPPAEISCQVLTVEPDRRFTHSYTDLRGDPPARWNVDWSLHREGSGTRILLTHGGFDIHQRQQRMARNAAERGWNNTVLPKLAEVVRDLET
ncbi:MAG: SRPBCC domain-containing protein [Rhodococcus sp.]|nr:SRPBCC domain-containing protein [Rhodococcus sp. (in: high G+C Gram-positive bacteria)]